MKAQTGARLYASEATSAEVAAQSKSALLADTRRDVRKVSNRGRAKSMMYAREDNLAPSHTLSEHDEMIPFLAAEE